MRFGPAKRDLVVGVVPRHDPEQRADRRLSDDRPATGGGGDRLVGQQGRALVGVVAVDLDDELDLADRLGGGLAHLPGDQRGERGDALRVEVGDPVQRGGPIGDGGPAPAAERALRPLDRGDDLGVGRSREGALDGTGGGVDDLVLDAHALLG